jgi:cytochrome P450
MLSILENNILKADHRATPAPEAKTATSRTGIRLTTQRGTRVAVPRGAVRTVDDFEATDFFRDEELAADPYPYFEALREQCPVRRERHHGVVMVTGYDEATEVFHDSAAFSSCISVTGPFPGFPVPLEGDDVTGLIEQHRDELPMSDQLPTLDPPVHTAHRALLMRLITPKRLKENEASMWRLADGLLDTFLARGEGEFISGFAGPFTLLVIADLLGVPEEDQQEFAQALQRRPRSGGGVGSTGEDTIAHSPLEFLYARFAAYIEDRRRQPRGDVLTGLATATFPDGSVPDVADVVRVAANLFSAGQETTVRLLSSALKVIAEHPDIQRLLRAKRDRIPNFVEETLRLESPVKGDFRLSRVPVTVGGVDLPAGTTVMVLNGAANRDPRRFAEPATFDAARPNARHHLAFGRGIHTCPGAPLARAEARVGIERLLDRTADIRISEHAHGPADARRYQYLPTFILRGLTRLNLEFTPAGEEAR